MFRVCVEMKRRHLSAEDGAALLRKSLMSQEMLLAPQEDGEAAKWQKSVNGSTTLVEHYSSNSDGHIAWCCFSV